MNRYIKNISSLFLVLPFIFWLAGFSLSRAATFPVNTNATVPGFSINPGDTLVIFPNVTLHVAGNFLNSGVLINDGTLKVDGDYNSTISGRSYNIDSLVVSGNFTNTSSVFLYTGVVVFNGLNQTIFSIPSANLYFDSLSVYGGAKRLSGSLIVGGQLDLEAVIQTTSSDTLGIDSAAFISGLAGFTTHFIQGPLYRRGRHSNTVGIDPVGMVFPVADENGVYRPLVLYSMPTYPQNIDKTILKIEAHKTTPGGATYGGGTLINTMSWDMELIGGKFGAGAYAEMVYQPADIAPQTPSTLSVLQAGPLNIYSSLGQTVANNQGILSFKKATLALGVPSTLAVGTGCIPVTAALKVAPKDTICTGASATFSVFTAGGATYDSVYYFVNGVLQLRALSGATYTTTTLANNDTVSALILNGLCIDTMNSIVMRVFTVVPFAGQDQQICAGISATLAGTMSVGGGTWTASSGNPPGGGLFSPNTSTLNATYTPSAVDLSINSVTLTLTSAICPARKDQMILTILPVPVAPTVSVSNITTSAMKFSWPAVAGATSYSISIDGGIPIALGAVLFYNLTGQLPSTSHTAKVKAINACGSGPDGTASGTTLAAAIAACDTSWTVAGSPFCIASLKSKLTPTVSGGVFTGSGVVFINPDYYFDPSVSGAGTFNVTYTRCGKFLTKSLVVNDAPCVAPITPSSSAGVPLISNPEGIATACDGSIYFSDTDDNAIWKIDPTGNSSVLLGDTTGPQGDANGPIKLYKPEGLIVFNGNIYFADAFNNKIKKYNIATNTITIIAGPAAFGTTTSGNNPSTVAAAPVAGSAALFLSPSSVTIDVAGTALYVADRGNLSIKKIDLTSPTFDVSMIATTANNPSSVAIYGNTLYYSVPNDNAIEAVDVTTKIVTSPSFFRNLNDQPVGLTVDCKGSVYYTNTKPAPGSQQVKMVTSSTTSTILLSGLNNATALSVYNKGFIDIANSGANQILRFAMTNWKSGAFNGLDTTHCVYDPADILNPLTCNVAGGFSFTGNGIQSVAAGSYKFNPSVAGVGRHRIVYKFNAGFCQDSLITYANVYPKPVPNLGLDQNLCTYQFGVDSLHAGKNGTKPYNPYQWFRSTTTGAPGTYVSVGGNTEFMIPPLPLPADIVVYYAVHVTDTNGCVGADTIKLTKLAVTAVAISGTDSICYGSSSTLLTQPGGFSSYKWNTGATSNSIIATQSGDYIVNATGANGCIAADTFRVTVRSLPAICISAPPQYGYGTWSVSTIAGSTTNVSGTTDNVKGLNARFKLPWDVYYNNGFLYVSETQRIRRIRLSDTLVTTFAGSLAGTVSDSVKRLAAKFSPRGVVADKFGNLYIANRDYIAKVDIIKDSVYMIAGSDVVSGYKDGIGQSAWFNDPKDIDIDAFGNIYVADYSNHVIRKVTPSGVVTTYAGSGPPAGHLDAIGTAAKFNWPFGVAFDLSANLFVVEEGGQIVRKINASQLTSTIAGAYNTAGYVSTTPWVPVAGNTARFSNPWNAVVDKTGRMFMTDALNQSIRMIDNSGRVTTIAGSVLAGSGVLGGADGLGNVASFNIPNGITMNPLTGDLYVADNSNNKIRKLSQNKTIAVCTGVPVTVDASSCSGNGNTYAWRKKGSAVVLSATATYSINAPGTYIVTVTDNKSCVNTDSVIAVLAPLPIANAGTDTVSCGPLKNRMLGTTAIAGNTYSWDTAPPTAAFSAIAQPTVPLISSTTSYVVTVTNTVTGCFNKDTAKVTINALPVFTLGPDFRMCAYGDSVLKGPSIAGATYNWTSSQPFQIGFDPTVSPAYLAPTAPVTDYYLKVTDGNSCVKTDTLRINLDPLPPASQGAYSSIYCRGSVINLGVAGNYNLYHYDWSTNNPPQNGGGYNNDTLSNPTFLMLEDLGIQFILTVKNRLTTCSTTVYGGVTVKPSPIAGFTSPPICYPNPMTFTDTSIVVGLTTDPITSWKWYFGDAGAVPPGSDTSDLQNPVPYMYSGPGLYNVKLVVDNGSCRDSVTKPVTINGLTVDYTLAPSAVCSGKAVTFTSTSVANPAGALSNTWDFGDGTPASTLNPVAHTFPIAAGTVPYSVKLVTTSNGCKDSTTKTVTVYPIPNATITSSSASACAGTNITLNVNPAYTSATQYKVIWRNVTTNTILSPAPQTTLVTSVSGTYRATVRDTIGGCADSSSVTLNFLNLPAGLAIAAPASSCSNAPLKLIATVTAGDSLVYAWTTSNGTGIFSNASNDTTLYTPSLTDASSLSFTVTATNRCASINTTQNVNLLASAPGSFTFIPTEPFLNDLVTFTPGDTTNNNIKKWVWNFQEGNAIDSVNFVSTHSFLHAGSFPVTLTLINNVGCPTVVTNFVDISGPVIYIPNVFEPTAANAENSVCKVYGTSVAPEEFSFRIFDKWGSVVYQTVDFTQANQTGWNGKNLSGGEPLPMGVYTYAVKGHFYDGSTFEKAGTVTLIR